MERGAPVRALGVQLAAAALGMALYAALFLSFSAWAPASSFMERVLRFIEQRGPEASSMILLLGGSQLVEGSDPGLIEETLAEHLRPGWRVYNVGLSAASTEHYLLYLPSLRETGPRLVVVGLTMSQCSLMFPLRTDFFRQISLTRDWVSQVDDEFFRVLGPIYTGALLAADSWTRIKRRREMLLEHLLARLTGAEDYRIAPSAFRERHVYTEADQQTHEALEARLVKRVGARYRAGYFGTGRDDFMIGLPAHFARLDYLLAGLGRRGVDAVIVNTPVHSLVRRYYSRSAHERYHQRLRQLVAGSADRSLLDMEKVIPDDEFVDYLHPNAAGRARFSRLLGRHIAEILSKKGLP